jgi:poly-gamma-glutamate capsule biosynthesis protein CapA/YwtB (metallophosphatase superfamily)
VSERGAQTRLIRRKPYFFRAPPSAVDALRAIGTSVAGLANNHALDFGEEALVDTPAHLEGGGIAPVGAGATVDDARRGVVVRAGALRLGVVALSDHPREYAAGHDRAGIAHAELHRQLPEWVTAEVGRLRSRADIVIAFLHWGPNMTTDPARWQRDRARELLAAGADAVAGHSAHVFHGVAPRLLYDLGDFIDDYRVDPRLRNDLGLLFLVDLATDRLQAIPLKLEFTHTRLATGDDATWIRRRFAHACAELGSEVAEEDGRLVLSWR